MRTDHNFLPLFSFQWSTSGKNGISLWDISDIEKRQAKEKANFDRLMEMDEAEADELERRAENGEGMDEDEEFDFDLGGEEMMDLDV